MEIGLIHHMYSIILLLCIIIINRGLSEQQVTYSARLVHRFSDEAKSHHIHNHNHNHNLRVSPQFPLKRSLEYYQHLLSSDLKRLKFNFQFLYPSQGSSTIPLGNDFGWLHYMWIDIGTPSVSFLVALDAGSDLFWVPCHCVKCAPLSSTYYGTLDKDLNEYNPSGSSTSKPLSCSHRLCELGRASCPDPKQQCPYTINYYSDDASTSGYLVEDVLHLVGAETDSSNTSVQAPVIIGCGSKQTGGYLNGVAPDGLLGLGLGKTSVPSFLAEAGYVRNSFSLCFNEDESGRLLFGDQEEIAGQKSTQLLPLEGKNLTYIVGVDACCIGNSCLENTEFEMLVDSGSSFTFLPNQVYERVVSEFNREINASKSSFEGYPWQYCYKSSSDGVPKIPSLTLKFATNNSFVVNNPVFTIYGTQGAVGFCFAVQATEDKIGTIGQNFMTGYRIVFDRENFKLGWSRSNCEDPDRMSLTPPGDSNLPNSLPTTAQQNRPNGQAVAPALAGRTPSKSSATCYSCFSMMFIWVLLVAGHASQFCTF